MEKQNSNPENPKTLDSCLEDVQVHEPGVWENDVGPKDWYAVSTANEGIIAYFQHERQAFKFRLDLINEILNGQKFEVLKERANKPLNEIYPLFNMTVKE